MEPVENRSRAESFLPDLRHLTRKWPEIIRENLFCLENKWLGCKGLELLRPRHAKILWRVAELISADRAHPLCGPGAQGKVSGGHQRCTGKDGCRARGRVQR